MLIMNIVLQNPFEPVLKEAFGTFVIVNHRGFRSSFHHKINSFPTGLVVVLQVVTFLLKKTNCWHFWLC